MAASPVVILRKSVAGLRDASLERFVSRVRRPTGLRGTVNVLVSTSRELRDLNRRFRKQDKPTDVLSFPPMLGSVSGLAGDIAISAEMAAENARLLGHSPADEIRILVLHGMLHLAGYDHERDHGEMAKKENTLRKSLGLPCGLLDRARTKPGASQRKPGKRRSAR